MEPAGADSRPGIVGWLTDLVRSDNAGGVFYGWRLVVIGFFIILVGREVSFWAWTSRGFDDVGIGSPWNIIAIAGGVASWLLSLFIAGRGVDRFGPKRMALAGLPLAGLVVLLAALPVPGVAQAGFVGVGSLALIGAYVPAITVLNNWFRGRLGLALALMLFLVAISDVVVDVVLPVLLSVLSWQLVVVASGVAIVVVALPLARLMRDRPEDWGEHPDGLASAGGIPDYSWREAMRSGQFWTLMAAGSCVAMVPSISNFYGWFVISEGSAGFEAIEKFGAYKEYASVAGILVGGLASYRFRVRYVLAGAAAAQTVGMVLLLTGFGPALLETGVLMGVASGMAAAPAIAAVGIYFGRRSFGAIIVTTLFIEQVVSSGLPTAAGYSASVWGGYVPMFVAAAMVSLVGAGLYWRLGRPRLAPSQRGENPAVS